MRPEAKQTIRKCNTVIADGLRGEKARSCWIVTRRVVIFYVVLASTALLLDVACIVEGWVAEFAAKGFDGLRVFLHVVLSSSS